MQMVLRWLLLSKPASGRDHRTDHRTGVQSRILLRGRGKRGGLIVGGRRVVGMAGVVALGAWFRAALVMRW